MSALSFSVAMTTCNGCPWVAEQLASIGAQTRRPDEIVIGDDQSTDATADVVARFAAQHGIPTHFERNAHRLGSTANFESVVRRCRGDVVVFADHDDVWRPQRLARLEAALAGDPAATFVFSDGTLIDGAGAPVPGTLFSSVGFDAQERAHFRAGGALDVLLKHNVVTGAALAVRRAALLRVLPFEPGWIHDYFIAFVLSALGRGLVLDDPLIDYRRHAAQQVGVADRSVATVLGLARRQNGEFCRREADNFTRLGARLVALGIDAQAPIVRDVAAKAAFFAARAGMRERPLRAPGLVLRHLRRGDYRRYALGWQQVVLDLVATAVNRPAATSGNDDPTRRRSV